MYHAQLTIKWEDETGMEQEMATGTISGVDVEETVDEVYHIAQSFVNQIKKKEIIIN